MGVKEHNTGKRPLLGQSNNALLLLVAVNGIFFIILSFLRILYFLSYQDNRTAEIFFQKQVLEWFMLPASPEKLLTRPWTVLVYMFSQVSVWGMISTVLWLWAFGYILQDLAGNKKLVPVYLYGGLAGALFFLLGVNLIPAFQQNISFTPYLAGGAPAVMAVAIATTTLTPEYRIFPMINGGIPLWVLTLVFVAIDFSTLGSYSGGYALAHLAGGITGFVFVRQLKKGVDWGAWMHDLVAWADDLFNPEKKQRKDPPQGRLFYKSSGKPFKKKSNISQQRLDDILDKINQQGYHFLTDEEKSFLERASREDL